MLNSEKPDGDRLRVIYQGNVRHAYEEERQAFMAATSIEGKIRVTVDRSI